MRGFVNSTYLVLSLFACAAFAKPVKIFVADRHYFPACKQPHAQGPYVAQICMRSRAARQSGDLSAISDLVARRELTQLALPKATTLIDESIAARDKLLECFDKKTAECVERIRAYEDTVNQRITGVRRALMLAQPEPGMIDPMSQAVEDLYLILPAFVGGKTLSQPTTDEYKAVDNLRGIAKSIYNHESVRDEKGVLLSHEGSEAFCRLSSTPACKKFVESEAGFSDRMRKGASVVAKRFLLEMPFLADYDKAPVTREQMKASLSKSRGVLAAWRAEISNPKDFDKFIFHYPQIIETTLESRPDLCNFAEAAFQRARTWERVGNFGLDATKAGLTVVACVLSEMIGCVPVATGMALLDGYGNYSDKKKLEARMTALGNDQLARESDPRTYARRQQALLKPEDVTNSNRDFLVSVAFDSLGLIPGAKAAHGFLGARPARAVAHGVEHASVAETVEALAPEEGSIMLDAAKRVTSISATNAEQSASQKVTHVGSEAIKEADMDDFLYIYLSAPAVP